MTLVDLCDDLAAARETHPTGAGAITTRAAKIDTLAQSAPAAPAITAALIRANLPDTLRAYLIRHGDEADLHPSAHSQDCKSIQLHFLNSPEVEALAAYSLTPGCELPFSFWADALIALINQEDCPRRLGLLLEAQSHIYFFSERMRDIYTILGPKSGTFLSEVFHDGALDLESYLGAIPLDSVTLKEFAMLLVQECDPLDYHNMQDLAALPVGAYLQDLIGKQSSRHGQLALKALEPEAGTLFARAPDGVFFGMQSPGQGLLKDAELA